MRLTKSDMLAIEFTRAVLLQAPESEEVQGPWEMLDITKYSDTRTVLDIRFFGSEGTATSRCRFLGDPVLPSVECRIRYKSCYWNYIGYYEEGGFRLLNNEGPLTQIGLDPHLVNLLQAGGVGRIDLLCDAEEREIVPDIVAELTAGPGGITRTAEARLIQIRNALWGVRLKMAGPQLSFKEINQILFK